MKEDDISHSMVIIYHSTTTQHNTTNKTHLPVRSAFIITTISHCVSVSILRAMADFADLDQSADRRVLLYLLCFCSFMIA